MSAMIPAGERITLAQRMRIAGSGATWPVWSSQGMKRLVDSSRSFSWTIQAVSFEFCGGRVLSPFPRTFIARTRAGIHHKALGGQLIMFAEAGLMKRTYLFAE